MDGGYKRILLIAAPWLAIVLAWYAVRASGLVNPALVPPPHVVAARAFDLLMNQGLLYDVAVSTRRVFIGVMVGIALAIPVGFVIGWFSAARAFADPLVNFCRALPPSALIPLVIVYFGVDEPAKLVILIYASFFSGVIVMY